MQAPRNGINMKYTGSPHRCGAAFYALQLFAFILAPASPAAWAGTALVGNENGGTISLIDTRTDEVIGEIKTSGKPRGTAIDARRGIAYVSDQSANGLLIIDIAKRTVVKRIELGESPEGVYISLMASWSQPQLNSLTASPSSTPRATKWRSV